MKKCYIFEKRVGETPLQALDRLRVEKKIPENISLSYAGRLDPMASGKLLVLVGNECKKQKKYHAWRKEYLVEVLLGIESDTGDPLGIIKLAERHVRPTHDELVATLRTFVGSYTSPYPAYSSKTVDGKPLFMYALEKKLDTIDIPHQAGRIYSIQLVDMSVLSHTELASYVKEKIARVSPVDEESKKLGANFRKDAVWDSWERELLQAHMIFPIARIRVTTSSGVYMRTLADDIAQKLGTRGLALSIHRTRIFKPLFK